MQPTSPETAYLKSDWFLATAILIVAVIVFWLSPVRQITDSKYSMLLSQDLLKFRSFDLKHYAISDAEVKEHTQLLKVGDHIYYYPPAGGPVLSVPFVAVMNALGVNAANPDGTYRLRGEIAMQAILAPLLMGLLASIFFLTARLILPITWSVLIALGGAFGTQVWSTASRALWSHTWEILLLGVAIWLLLAAETGRQKLRPILLATVLSWTYFSRPTATIPILAITIYMILSRRRWFWPYAITGAIWAALFGLYSWIHFRHYLPNYYRENVIFSNPWLILRGSLFSPARGLFIYVPVTLVVFYLIARFRKDITLPRMTWLSLGVVLGHLLVLTSLQTWWGGGCYGARLTTDLVPWFVLLAILGVSAMLKWRERIGVAWSRPALVVPLALGAVLLAFSVFANARGAIAIETAKWEDWRWQRPPLERDTSAFWNWRYPQFMAGLIRPPIPETFPVLNAPIEMGDVESGKFIWYGWSGPETPTRWTDGREAAVIFSLGATSNFNLEMIVAPFVAGDLQEQVVNTYLNDQLIGQLDLVGAETRAVSLLVPRDLIRDNNVLRFQLLNATSPLAVGFGDDERLLGMKVTRIGFRPAANK
ncbi:MAG TPA: hypothetical protein VN643_25595 [Pyrinomonadaceae bacterium]|nr:hypothetical protein [Pyrinomonadaceae bacterium]